jgi:AbiV family abortive infection protein
MREWDPSLRIHLHVAKAAVDNAENLAKASLTLLDVGHAGPAAALAVTGQEETGKALLFTLIGFGLVPEDVIPEAINLGKDHGRKQQLAMVGHVLAQIAPKIRPHVDGIPDDLEATEQLLRPLLSRIVPALLDQVKAFFAERPDFEERIAAIPVDRELQELKHRGLYVDVKDDRVIGPPTVTASEASAALADLRASIEGIRLFTQIATFSDEGVRLARAVLDPHLALAKGLET